MIRVIYSGMQTGADIAGTCAGKRVGLRVTGYMPKHFRTEVGNKPEFKERFNAIETDSSSYLPRTLKNAMETDATIILSVNKHSAGTRKTIEYCKALSKPYIVINPFNEDEKVAVDFINTYQPEKLNVAGNRESVAKGITNVGVNYLEKVFRTVLINN